MNIRTMTASFGGLENETLTLSPGLNVILLPNGGGKTTWCAFFEAMLYGLGEEKEAFVPWSGGPMSGKMDLLWENRAVTLERDFRAGTFQAYETQTGEPMPELTAENCGRQLLGLDKDGYQGLFGGARKSEKQRFHVCQRLEAGLTEGAERCGQELTRLRDSLASWRKGRQDRQELERKAAQLDAQRLEAENFCLRLEHYLYTLDHGAGAQETQRVRNAYERCLREQEELEAFVKTLPTGEEARRRREDLKSYCAAWAAVQKARETLGLGPEPPACPEAFRELDLRQVQQKAEEDTAQYRDSVGSISLLLLMLGLLGLLLGCIAAFPMQKPALGLAVMGLGVLALAGAVLFCGRGRNRLAALGEEYGTQDWQRWPEIAQSYIKARIAYEEIHAQWDTRKKAIRQRLQELEAQKERLCEGRTPEEMDAICCQVLEKWDALDQAKQRTRSAKARLDAMGQEEPGRELGLTKTEAKSCLDKARQELGQLQEDLEGIQTTLKTLETEASLNAKIQQAEARESSLSQYEKAYGLAIESLGKTVEKIESRGRQEIASLAAGCFMAVTGLGEEALRAPSGGTHDAAALAQCLARVQVYGKETPLLLDDVLARLDDTRMQKALVLLKGQERQIVLFTCQNREKAAAGTV